MESALTGSGKLGMSSTSMGLSSSNNNAGAGPSNLVYPVNYHQSGVTATAPSTATNAAVSSKSASEQPSAQQITSPEGQQLPDFDELSKRFEALKKQK